MKPASAESSATPQGVDVSIVATVFKSATLVEPLVDEIVQVMSATDYRFEILLVDDSSPDHSWAEIVRVAKADPRVRGIRLRRNRGQQIAAKIKDQK